MPGLPAFGNVSVSFGRLLLPWMVVLLASVMLAYAATSAVTSSWAVSSGATAAAVDEVATPGSRESCPAYSGAIGWMLHDLARGSAC